MTYELAKQLKDADFPYGQHSFALYYADKESDSRIGSPMLAELIAACGKDFSSLTRLENVTTPEVYWVARGRKGGIGSTTGPWLEGKASTADEAVVKLWLALNG